MNSVHHFSVSDYLLFRVELDKDIGYSFVNSTPIGKDSYQTSFQYIGFALVLAGLVWVSRDKLGLLRKIVAQNRWRLVFLVFAIIYAVFLLLDLALSPIQTDEIIHLNKGIELLNGTSLTYPEISSFCPNFFDVVTLGFFKFIGVSVFSGRLVSVVFSLLSVWIVFEFANQMFGSKIGLVSSVLFGIMPGYFWLSRMALVETMLVFFFTLSLLFFFKWLRSQQIWCLAISGVALGLGFLTQHQILIAGVIMIASILILCRGQVESKFLRFPLILLIIVLIVILWINESYEIFTTKMLGQSIYALQPGTPEKLFYSTRFDLLEWLRLPIFYLIEMTWSCDNFHPISFFLFIIGLVGLGFFMRRKRDEDKYLLIWYLIVYLFFTLVANKHWRQVISIFPVLAISASSLIFFVKNKIGKAWRSGQLNVKRKRIIKVVAGVFTLFMAVSVLFSGLDAHYWVTKNQIKVPIDAATRYTADRLSENETIMVACASNLFSQDIVRFYLYTENNKDNMVIQYPELPVDSYMADFNITEFITLCEIHNVKYVLFYEGKATGSYFCMTLSLQEIFMDVYDSGRFSQISKEITFGYTPHRIFVLTFYK